MESRAVHHTTETFPYAKKEKHHPERRRLLTTGALLVGISATAHAGTLSTGALYGGASQHSALCGFFNAGTAITITAAELVDFFGGNIVDQNNGQVTPLGPGDSCYFSGNPIPSGPEGSEGRRSRAKVASRRSRRQAAPECSPSATVVARSLRPLICGRRVQPQR